MKKSKFRNHAFYKPNTVQFELVESCNRNCSFCGTLGFEKKFKFIDKKVLTKECQLVRESGYNPRILLAGHGENTLHPKFLQCIRIMRREMPNAWIQILNNGVMVKKDINFICEMFLAGINDVTMDEYSDSKFDHKAIQELLDQFEQDHGIHVDFEIMKKGVPLYAAKQPKKHRLLIIPAIDEEEICVSRKITNHCGAALPPSKEYRNRKCTRIFRELSFRWDGSVCMCCQDFRGEYYVENCMNVDSFDELWRHPRLEAVRRITYHDGRTFFPCSICNHMPMREGLLPDHLGKDTMEKPTKEDYEIVSQKFPPRTDRIPRPWELKKGKFCNGDPIEKE